MDDGTLAKLRAERPPPDQAFDALCYAPFNNLFFDNKGDVRVCCWNWLEPVGNVLTHSMDEIWRGEPIRRLREALASYRLAEGCGICRFQTEDGAVGGLKLRNFDRLPAEGPDPAWPRQFEFSISNACNLQCVMCDGTYSSAIRAHREGKPPLPRLYDERFLRSLAPYLPHLRQAKFLGGEPFLVTEHFLIWDMMIAGDAQAVCHVTTNGTQAGRTVARYLDRLRFAFAVSLDAATKETFEAIRVGASWDEVLANARSFREHARQKRTSFSFTFCLMRTNWREFGALCRMADAWEANVGVNTVRRPPHLGLYNLALPDLREVLRGLEAEAPALERDLTRNKRVWFAEFERIRARVGRLESGASTESAA
jgi:MoaA/NifB/PqqE/SkfB family radical SAM enzyme